MNSSDVKKCATDHGADLVGIASIKHFKDLPMDENPLCIAPECKSVIVLGRRILRGALRGIEEGTNFFSTYGFFGFQALEDNFLSQTIYDTTCFIETFGFEAVPLFGYSKEGMATGVPVAEGKPAPNVFVNINYAAHAAGLGELGRGDFFLTKKYGPRQRFSMILTDAELEPDPVFKDSICDQCGKCAAICPFNAINMEKEETIGIVPNEMKIAKIDYNICRSCPNGAMMGPGRGTKPDRLGAACARACMIKLEEDSVCDNKFIYPFRKRTPWILDAFLRPPAGGGDIGGARKTN